MNFRLAGASESTQRALGRLLADEGPDALGARVDTSSLSAITRNVVRARIDGRWFALKPRGPEAQILAFIASCDDAKSARPSRTARPSVLPDGVLVQSAEISRHGQHRPLAPVIGGFILTPWIEGIAKTFDRLEVDDWHLLGRALAGIQALLSGYPSPETSQGSRPKESEPPRSDPSPHEVKEFLALQARLRAFAQRLGVTGQLTTRQLPTRQLLHNDFNQHNFLWNPIPDQRSVAIIDFDRAAVASPDFELVRTLNHLPLVNPEGAQAYIRGFAAHQRALHTGTNSEGPRPLALCDADEQRQRLLLSLRDTLIAHAEKSWPIALLEDANRAFKREPSDLTQGDLLRAQKAFHGSLELLRALADGAARMNEFYVGLAGRF